MGAVRDKNFWCRYAISHTNHSHINQFLGVMNMKCIQNFCENEIQPHLF